MSCLRHDAIYDVHDLRVREGTEGLKIRDEFAPHADDTEKMTKFNESRSARRTER
jgi:hypothetical protein